MVVSVAGQLQYVCESKSHQATAANRMRPSSFRRGLGITGETPKDTSFSCITAQIAERYGVSLHTPLYVSACKNL